MIQTFREAVFISPPKIMGRKLRPFSLGHHFTLKAFGNPCVTGGEASKSDLAGALYTCTLTWREIQRKLILSDIYHTEIQEWIESLSDAKEEDWMTAYQLFIEYQSEYSQIPEHWRSENEKGIRHPWEWVIIVELCKNDVIETREEGWNMPIGEAHCWYSVIGETYGNDSLVTDSEMNPQVSEENLNKIFRNGTTQSNN